MSLSSLLRSPKPARFKFGAEHAGIVGPDMELVLEVVIREQHQRTANVTQWPVEEGADITDHIHIQPERLVLDVVISDHPAAFFGLAPLLKGVGASPSNDARELLQLIMDERLVFDVELRSRDYSNMVLTSVSETRTVRNGAALVFTAALQEVQTVASETAAIDNPDTEPIAASNDVSSNKTPAPADPEITKKAEQTSFFHDIFVGGP